MPTIWKFEPDLTAMTILAPAGATVLSVMEQRDQLQVWALVNSANAPELIQLQIYGTGHPVPENPGRFINTFQMAGGDLIFHAFQQEA